ncbi:hypothetical protein KP509_32G073000 [Ceratopteris richardii]|uniref:PPM-type phosphatase domain-containing protein n=1 Tax=Ceratopteris richardii TaxID=49495 RepID=A0A8T2QWF0_CERRI|nr:hypothetical protein KP509_32G073000 [Ceratopteris richardii]
MGSSLSRSMTGCFVASSVHNTRQLPNDLFSESYEGLGHSFCYIRPSAESPLHVEFSSTVSSDQSYHDRSSADHMRRHLPANPNDDHFESLKSLPETTFKTISGASVSANTSTPCTIVGHKQTPTFVAAPDDRAAAFECTSSFSSLPLQPIPKGNYSLSSTFSGTFPFPIDKTQLLPNIYDKGCHSGILERRFLSGPLERSCLSGPIDGNRDPSHFSAPLPGSYTKYRGNKRRESGFFDVVRKPLKKIYSGTAKRTNPQNTGPIKEPETFNDVSSKEKAQILNDEVRDLQWAHGKAGEDRIHVVLSDKHGWLFIGIYDGFNGPDAPDYLLRNLYTNVYKELEGLLWDTSGKSLFSEKQTADPMNNKNLAQQHESNSSHHLPNHSPRKVSARVNGFHVSENRQSTGTEKFSSTTKLPSSTKRVIKTQRGMSFPASHHQKYRESHMTFQEKYSSLYEDECEHSIPMSEVHGPDHFAVLQALKRALDATENAYLDMADRALKQNPELALMGSCLLVMLMKDEDVYIMNVGDSRAILGQYRRPVRHHRNRHSYGDLSCNSKADYIGSETRESIMRMDLQRFIEEIPTGEQDQYNARCSWNMYPTTNCSLTALQLSKDHCTSEEEEVCRIKSEHSDSDLFLNNRVKGTLKVTRAFGAGFLKKPHWNSAILEMFRINYEGTAPYINCSPSLCHHRLSQNDRFLILSSDGLYQYLTNEEVVSHVEWFMEMFPEGDPAQHLVEELLYRAAKRAGMGFHELLDVPQGDRRKYHDDVSVMVISLQGRIWRSCS